MQNHGYDDRDFGGNDDEFDTQNPEIRRALQLRELGEMNHGIPREERCRFISLADGILRLHEGGGREDYRD